MHDSDREALEAARTGDRRRFDEVAGPHRREILVHCYRMVGSFSEAEELVQEALLRAWQRMATFEARGSFRAWLYRIATNVCLNALEARAARRLPRETGGDSDPRAPLAPRIAEPVWIEPLPEADLEREVLVREEVALAFVSALQYLPAAQRAALLLRDVLDFRADETAAMLDTTVDGVNGLLHRARASLGRARENGWPPALPPSPEQEVSLARFAAAWERGDIQALATLLAQDAALSMPPVPSWFSGRDAIAVFLGSETFARARQGGFRLHPTRANGQPAFAFYRREGDRCPAHSLMVVSLRDTLVAEMVTFLDPSLVVQFGPSRRMAGLMRPVLVPAPV